MAKEKQTPEQQQYQKIAKKYEKKRPVLKNCIIAFFVGGAICVIGQCLQVFYYTFFDFTEKSASNPTVATLIFIATLITGLGFMIVLPKLQVQGQLFLLRDLPIQLHQQQLSIEQKAMFSVSVATCLS